MSSSLYKYFLENIDRRHMEYLPYPDWNFDENFDESLPKVSNNKNGFIYFGLDL